MESQNVVTEKLPMKCVIKIIFTKTNRTGRRIADDQEYRAGDPRS